MSNRKLNLRRELLTDLSPEEMRLVAAAEAPFTQGGICTAIITASALAVLYDVAAGNTFVICAPEQEA